MGIIAVIFDYDDTIVPDTITQLLEYHRIDVHKFWESDFKKKVEQGFCPTHAYLNLILNYIGKKKPLGALTNKNLRKFGKVAAKMQYSGLHGLIRDLKKIREKYRDLEIEFYIISGGLEEIIKGNKFVYDNFSGIYGCRLYGKNEKGTLKYIKRAITFTEKTRYLFEINKGIIPEESDRDPSAVNKHVNMHDRRVPFKNMLYIGDGLTDIPCFSLVNQNEGTSFGILHTERTASVKIKILEDILKTKRTVGAYAPRYGKKEPLGDLIRLTVEKIAADNFITKKSLGR